MSERKEVGEKPRFRGVQEGRNSCGTLLGFLLKKKGIKKRKDDFDTQDSWRDLRLKCKQLCTWVGTDVSKGFGSCKIPRFCHLPRQTDREVQWMYLGEGEKEWIKGFWAMRKSWHKNRRLESID